MLPEENVGGEGRRHRRQTSGRRGCRADQISLGKGVEQDQGRTR